MADADESAWRGYADLLLTALCWSFLGFFTRSNTCSALLTAGVSSLSALVFLLVVVRPTLRLTRRAALVGLASCAVSVTFIYANKLTTVGNAIVLQYSSTVFVIVYESIASRRLPQASKVFVVAMALAGIKLWELIDLAMPMVICLVLQCVVMFLFSYFVVFNVMGRSYDAAVMTAGFIGFAMGATSNAMANMQVVTKKYGPSPVAYFAIPMVGGMFIDFFNAVLISANIGWWA